MKIFDKLFKRGKKENNTENNPFNNKNQSKKNIDISDGSHNNTDKMEDNEVPIEKKRFMVHSDSERDIYITESCERIKEASQLIDDIKIEYQLVTSYLSDIQKIEMLPLEEKEILNDSARKIVNLTNERLKFQRGNGKITDNQFKSIEKIESEIQTISRNMKELEDKNALIRGDMLHLEGEKSALKFEIEESTSKQTYLNKLTILTVLFAIILSIIFALVSNIWNFDRTLPIMIIAFFAAIGLTAILLSSRKTIHDIKVSELKLNKAINLLNKVKIKYINNTNNLDYVYNKYDVSNYRELNYLWEEYIKAKDELKRYKKTTELLDYYNEELINFLKNLKISDANIWIHQALAIINDKEMTEIKYRLTKRRQKLKERIEYNQKVKDYTTKDINALLQKYPEVSWKVMAIVNQYEIQL